MNGEEKIRKIQKSKDWKTRERKKGHYKSNKEVRVVPYLSKISME